MNLEILAKSPKRLPRFGQLHLPVAVPDRPCALIDARNAGAGAVDALFVIEAPAAEIAQGKMRHVQIVNVPLRLVRIACNRLAEEGQFETETMPVGGPEIAGVVPPLGLIVGMIEVIARKLVMIPGQRESVIRGLAEHRGP